MNFDHYANVLEDEDCIKLASLEPFYNPNSDHFLSKRASSMLEQSKQIVSTLFPQYRDVEFIPSGGTGANIRAILENSHMKNVAVSGWSKDVVMISGIEHSSIKKKVAFELNIKNYTIVYFPVNADGFVDIEKFITLFDEFKERIVLVSCISTNNEIGTIQPIQELINIVKAFDANIIFHSDCACNLGNVRNFTVNPDIITFSCYKFHGPHIGILLTNIKMNQDRFGTPDVKNFYFASLALQKYIAKYENTCMSQLKFKSRLKEELYSAFTDNDIEIINFDTENSATNVIAFATIGIKTSLIKTKLSDALIAIGSGSACTTHEGSHTIEAMGYSKELSQQLVRLSFNYDENDIEIIKRFVEEFVSVINSLKYIKKNTNIDQKVRASTIVRTSTRSVTDQSDVTQYDLSILSPPTFNIISLSGAEQSLKGKNKDKFNDILTSNIKSMMKTKFPEIKYKVKARENTHEITFTDLVETNLVVAEFQKMPGISVISLLEETTNLPETVVKHYLFTASDFSTTSFAIRVKISGKQFEGLTNKDWEYLLGKTIEVNFGSTVNLTNPNVTIHVRGIGGKICVGQRFSGIGGLPCGTEGNILFFVDCYNFDASLHSIIAMYVRGTIPVVFTNSNTNYLRLEEFLKNNCTKYTLKKITNDTFDEELACYVDTKHLVYETSINNYISLKEFGKKIGKYVFSIGMSQYETHNTIFTEKMNIYKPLTVLPSASNGLMLISGGIDSPVASHVLSTHSIQHQYVNFIGSICDDVSRNKIMSIVRHLNQKSLTKSTIFFVDFGKLQEEVAKVCAESYRVMMYKIYMVLLANFICKENGYSFIGMGNSLGQVASQTPQNLYITDHFSELPMLSPLVGMTKNDIITVARAIGTYDFSICSGIDCCVQFLPANPILNASEKEIHKFLKIVGDPFRFVEIHKYEI